MTGNLPLDRGPRWLKVAGAMCAGWTVGILTLFALGEGLEGAGHLIQLLPLLAAIVLAWRSPSAGGAVLVVVGGLLALLYAAAARGSTEMLVTTELVMLLPPIVGGGLFLLAGRRHPRTA